MKQKFVTFCFLKLKNKRKTKFPQNHREEGDFSVDNLILLLTQLSAEVVAMGWWKRKTRDYHQKLNSHVASRIAEKIAVYLSFY